MMKRFSALFLAFALLLGLCAVPVTPVQAASGYSKATSIAVGDMVLLVSEAVSQELSSISTTSTKYGIGTAYSSQPGGLMVLEVCAGYSSGTFAFKNNGKYLTWTSGNSLNVNATLSANTSWKVSFDASGNASILNSADSTRQIWWNVGSPRFASYTGKTDGASFKSVQLYKASANTCLHSSTSYAVTTAPGCTTSGTGTYTCKDCGYSWTVTVAATGHSYAYTLVNGAIYSVCSGCSDAQGVSLHTIAQAKAYTSDTQVYNIQGVVTYVSGRTAYIEDATGGLCVYFDLSVDTSTLAQGQKIFVSSTMTNYNGLLELNKPKSFLLLSSGNSLPNVTNLSIADILADTELSCVGKRVTLKNLTIGVVNPTGFTTLTDSTGNSLSIYRATGLSEEIVGGNVVNVTAIISYYSDGYQLLVNPATASTDVVKLSDGTAVEIETVSIATAKAGIEETYYQVEGVVTCLHGRQIFIQDETGGIVIYLAAMPTEAPCAVGDKIRVYGSFGNYDGVLELQYVDHTNPKFFSVLSSGHQVVAQPVTIDELLRDSSIEYEYFAEKVFLNDVSILEIDTNGSVLLWQDDCTMNIYAAPQLNEGCEIGAVVDVTATVSGYSYNYELVIADANAVTFGTECQHEETVAVNVIAPSCTESGYSGDVYCTVCGAYISAGETTAPAHTIVAVNAVAATCVSEGYTGEQYCEVCGEIVGSGSTIAPLGHDYVAGAVVEPTCTTEGYTNFVCSRCTDGYRGEIVGATGHDCVYSNQGEVHSYLCGICFASGQEDHQYARGLCLFCGAEEPVSAPTVDESIGIYHSLNLASDIAINFVIPTQYFADYDSYYLECLLTTYEGNEAVGQESILLDSPTLNGDYYYFTLSGINATQMGDEVQATLYLFEGENITVSKTDVYSVGTYAYSQLNKSNSSDVLKTLCADLLRYGAAAQTVKSYRTNALVDAAMTDTHKGYLSDLDAVTFGNNAAQLGDIPNPVLTWKGKTLLMDSKVLLRFVFDASGYTGNIEDLTLRVSYRDYTGQAKTAVVESAVVYPVGDSWYAFDFDGLQAAELRTVVSVAVYEGETQLSETMQYSADSYGNGKTGNVLAVCKAMIAYSDSALAYFVAS